MTYRPYTLLMDAADVVMHVADQMVPSDSWAGHNRGYQWLALIGPQTAPELAEVFRAVAKRVEGELQEYTLASLSKADAAVVKLAEKIVCTG